MQRTNIFLKIKFSFFQKTAKKKIICIKSILDIFIFVHFEKVDPSFVFDVFLLSAAKFDENNLGKRSFRLSILF